MHAERDVLRNLVLPELEERLRRRRCYLEPIDLRWGVDPGSAGEEHARELFVLKVCLAEVERSRPFLVGILGDRYGWMPPADRMEAAAREPGFDRPVSGRSITDLEIDFGVLSSPEQRRRCFFYFRDPLPYDRMPEELAARYSDRHDLVASEKLNALKGRIEAELPDRVRRYRGTWDPVGQCVTALEDWGRSVVEDLWRELDAETAGIALEREPTWQEAERFTLEQFLQERTRGFVGREKILADLERLALSPSSEGAQWGACVTGAAGSGKSALFVELYRRLATADCFVLAHAAGISPRSGDVDAMLLRWIGDLSSALGVPVEVREDAPPEEVEKAFHSLLGRASANGRVILLVDALNQFIPTARAKYLAWLPKIWPSNARFIATAIPGVESEATGDRAGTELLMLPPLSEKEAFEIVDTICRKYRRHIRPEIVGILTAKCDGSGRPAAGNPLWLSLAAEELNLLDADDFARMDREFAGTPEERLQQLIRSVAGELPAEIEALYGWMLDRAEGLFGKPWVDAFVNLVALGRSGWRESDFRVLMPALSGRSWDDLSFAALRRTFRGHVSQRDSHSQWDFAHAQMRSAVTRRKLGDTESAERLHKAVADHLLSLPREDALHESETMVHLIGAGDRLRAARYYASPLMEGEVKGTTRILAEPILTGAEDGSRAGLDLALSLLGEPGLQDEERHVMCNRFLFDLDSSLEDRTVLDVRRTLFEASRVETERLAAADPGNAGWQRDLSVSHERIGNVLTAQGNLDGALKAFQAGLKIAERLAAADPGNAGWQRDLSVSHNKVGNVLTAQGNLDGALKAFQASHKIFERLAAADPGNAGWQRDLVVSFFKLGSIAGQGGKVEKQQASTWWYRCHETLVKMKRSGMYLDPPLVQLLEKLQRSFGG
jgi:tetratricopeptide (TPR) repeat protein